MLTFDVQSFLFLCEYLLKRSMLMSHIDIKKQNVVGESWFIKAMLFSNLKVIEINNLKDNIKRSKIKSFLLSVLSIAKKKEFYDWLNRHTKYNTNNIHPLLLKFYRQVSCILARRQGNVEHAPRSGEMAGSPTPSVSETGLKVNPAKSPHISWEGGLQLRRSNKRGRYCGQAVSQGR